MLVPAGESRHSLHRAEAHSSPALGQYCHHPHHLSTSADTRLEIEKSINSPLRPGDASSSSRGDAGVDTVNNGVGTELGHGAATARALLCGAAWVSVSIYPHVSIISTGNPDYRSYETGG